MLLVIARATALSTKSPACMPVQGQGQGQGQVLGLLHIAVDVDARSQRPARDAEQRLRAMTDRVGPALANLKLRDALREMALRDGLIRSLPRRRARAPVRSHVRSPPLARFLDPARLGP
jgi:hypothetical protein